MLAEVLNMERSALFVHAQQKVSTPQARRYRLLIRKRRTRIPVAYLLGKAYFWDEVLEVDESCLIPRPETEILVDSFIRHSGFNKSSSFSFLDLGCGTGAIGIALLRYFPKAVAMFSDISGKALHVTRKNLKNYGLLSRARCKRSNWFEVFPGKEWDAIVCNPPYVADEDWHTLEPELGYEPETALRGGKGGLIFYKQISKEAKHFLKPGGLLVFEMGAGQAKQIKLFLRKQGFKSLKIFKDHLNIDRVVMAQKGSERSSAKPRFLAEPCSDSK